MWEDTVHMSATNNWVGYPSIEQGLNEDLPVQQDTYFFKSHALEEWTCTLRVVMYCASYSKYKYYIATTHIRGEPVHSSLAAENPHCSVVCMQLKITLDWLSAPTSVFPNCPAILQAHHLTWVVRKVLRYEWPKVALANKTETHALQARKVK